VERTRWGVARLARQAATGASETSLANSRYDPASDFFGLVRRPAARSSSMNENGG
jgi:hypothetical protein